MTKLATYTQWRTEVQAKIEACEDLDLETGVPSDENLRLWFGNSVAPSAVVDIILCLGFGNIAKSLAIMYPTIANGD